MARAAVVATARAALVAAALQPSGLSKVAQAAVRRAAQSLVRTTSLTSLARWVLYTCILPAAAALLWWLY